MICLLKILCQRANIYSLRFSLPNEFFAGKKKKEVLSVVFFLPDTSLTFPSHVIHLLHCVGSASVSLLKISSFDLFLSFGWDSEEEKH